MSSFNRFYAFIRVSRNIYFFKKISRSVYIRVFLEFLVGGSLLNLVIQFRPSTTCLGTCVYVLKYFYNMKISFTNLIALL